MGPGPRYGTARRPTGRPHPVGDGPSVPTPAAADRATAIRAPGSALPPRPDPPDHHRHRQGQRHLVIRAVKDELETRAVITATAKTSRDRSKTGPTRHQTTRPTRRRRRTPSPTSQRPVGKRPEGHAPTDRRILPRAAHRNQDVTTISTPTRPHRPRGAAPCAGFHLHAHATPPRWETIPFDSIKDHSRSQG